MYLRGRMLKISVKEARRQLRRLLDSVERGNEVTILRRGKEVARLVPITPEKPARKLPRLTKFRASLRVSGKPLSAVVIKERQKERY